MRLFVAIELDAALRAHAGKVQRAIRADLAGASPVRPGNLHLTLKFLGETPDERLPAVCAALAGVPRPGVFRLRVAGGTCFPERGRVRVVGLALGGDLEALAGLAASIDDAAAASGYRREGRAFAAHVTLARARTPLPPEVRDRVDGAVAAAGPSPMLLAQEFVLMQSVLDRRGAQYTVAARFPLQALA